MISVGTDSEYRENYLRQLYNHLNYAIGCRSSLIILLENHLNKGKKEERRQIIETTIILACYAGVATLLPTVTIFCLGVILQLHHYKELSCVTAVAGISTYFVLRLLQSRSSYKTENFPQYDMEREKLLEEIKRSSDLLARELHGLLVPSACVNLNTAAREFIEKGLVFGVQIPNKPITMLHSFQGRRIRLKELEVTSLAITCGRDWMFKLRRFVKELMIQK